MESNQKPILIARKVEFSIGEKMSFWKEDLQMYVSKLKDSENINIQYISDLFVPKQKRHKGIATKMLNDFCVNHSNSLILLHAGASHFEYEEEPSDDELSEIIDTLVDFYYRCGFIDVNEFIGDYDTSCAMVYKNNIGKQLISVFPR